MDFRHAQLEIDPAMVNQMDKVPCLHHAPEASLIEAIKPPASSPSTE
ncbi:hypothetical protein [Caballeronia sp. LZ032]|nr:hypothetical protein [Caballeronia sp. LZ032]MDR5881618.1 hypothetical protein [Caballeronia sp. LZ032]